MGNYKKLHGATFEKSAKIVLLDSLSFANINHFWLSVVVPAKASGVLDMKKVSASLANMYCSHDMLNTF